MPPSETWIMRVIWLHLAFEEFLGEDPRRTLLVYDWTSRTVKIKIQGPLEDGQRLERGLTIKFKTFDSDAQYLLDIWHEAKLRHELVHMRKPK